MPSIALFSFVVYLLLVASVAFLAYHYTKNLSDFVLGGRKLNGPVAALSSGASDMSAWLLLALPGAAFTFGMNQIWLPIGLVIGAYCNWRWVGAPLRVYTEMANDSLTVPAYLDNRFEDKSHAIRISSALATLIFFAVYTASGLVAGAMLLQRSFGLDFNTALLSGTLIIMAYTFIGGFLAVSWTDFFQGIFMMCCLLILPVLIVIDLGGFGHVLQLLQAQGNGFLHPTHGMTLLAFVNLMTWGLGYFGQPHILVRFMAVKGVKDIPVAGRIVVAWMSFAMVGAVAVGILGAAYFSAGQINPESVFIEFSNVMFSPWISGMILAAIMSSIMCAIDSQMLASTSALTEDLYRPLLRPKASQKELMWISRFALFFISGIAMYLAWWSGKGVLSLVSFSWAGLSATFAAPVVLSLFWRDMTRNGAVLGMTVGALVALLCAWQPNIFFGVYQIVPGMLFSALAVVVGSHIGPKPTLSQKLLFDAVWKRVKLSRRS